MLCFQVTFQTPARSADGKILTVEKFEPVAEVAENDPLAPTTEVQYVLH